MIPPWVDLYVGIPYLSRGEGQDGADCYGLVRMVLADVYGRKIPRYDYLNADDVAEIQGVVKGEQAKWQRLAAPAEGAMILLNLAGEPVHMGVVLNDEFMLHTMRGHASAIERFTSRKWTNRIEGFYSYEH